MPDDPRDPSDSSQPTRRLQFGMPAIFGTVALACILLGAGSGVLGHGRGGISRGLYLLLTMAVPVAAMIVLSLYYSARGRRSRSPDEYEEDE